MKNLMQNSTIYEYNAGLEFHFFLGKESPYKHLWKLKFLGGIKNTFVILQYLILL